MNQPLLILGAGTFAVETLDIAEAAGGFAPLGFVNSLERPPRDAKLEGLPVFWSEDLPFAPGECRLVAGIVSTRRRAFVEMMAARGYGFASVVHPAATVSARARLGAGCVVHAGAVVSSNTRIGDHVILNRGALVGHDNVIEPFCTIGPGANLAGGLHLGSEVYVGVGAVVRDHLQIATGAVIGAGAVVVAAVAEGTLVVGVPARVVKTGVRGL